MGKNNTTKLQLGFNAKQKKIPLSDIVITAKGIRTSGLSQIINHLAEEQGVRDMMIIHAQTDELLARYDEYEAALERGDKEVEVLVWDIPKELAFGVLLLKHGKDFGCVNGYEPAKKAMSYFSFSENGDGAALRRVVDTGDKSLPDFVGKLFKTNRTNLYKWLELGDNKRFDLLRSVDENILTIGQAFDQFKPRTKGTSTKTNTCTGRALSRTVGNRFTEHEEVARITEFSPDEIDVLSISLPEVLRSITSSETVPLDYMVERVYQHTSANDRRKGNATRKLDHLNVSGQVSGYSFQIFLRPDYDTANSAVVRALTSAPSDEQDEQEYRIAA